MTALDDILRRLGALPAEEREAVTNLALQVRGGAKWVPNPGPQTEAYFSKADELFYGGAAGGGKSSLICGLAINEFSHSHIYRREARQLRGIVEELRRIIGDSEGYNSQDKIWRLADGKIIELDGVKDETDKEKWQGRAAPFKAFDEITQFTESQYRYIIGWNRATSGERCRVVATGNPPITAEGAWVVRYWSPWLDPTHPRPAKVGELRWFTTIDGKDVEVGKDYVGPKGERPRSRTFILSRLEDNPDLLETGYSAVIEAMPEPLRTMMREGRFDVATSDDPWQLIPTAWIREAQERWTPEPPLHAPMCAMGVDVAAGGEDNTVIACRYDGWFAPLIVVPGRETPHGTDVAGLVIKHRRNSAVVIIDMGGGYGGAPYEHLRANLGDADRRVVFGHKGAEASTARTADKQLRFANKRSEVWWRLREALDPSQQGGSTIALPNDPGLIADLTAPHFEVTPSGIKVEPKDHIVKRLGRSPDRGDAVVMAWSQGQKALTHATIWRGVSSSGGHARQPQVVMGRKHSPVGRGRAVRR